MKGQGNSDPAVCAGNLMSLYMGEVPYDRTRGMDPDLVDDPADNGEYLPEVEEMLEMFEPRAEISWEDMESMTGGDTVPVFGLERGD